MKASLRKVKWNKGVVADTGREYDYTRIYIEAPIWDGASNEFGLDTIQLEYGNEEAHKNLFHLKGKLPVDVEIEYIDMVKGNDVLKVVQNLKVLTPQPVTPKP
jgi:hypothetical protein